MSAILADAARKLDLRPGQTYREEVDGVTFELRIVDAGPTPEPAEQGMLQPWVEFPFNPVGTVIPTRGTIPPSPFPDEKELADSVMLEPWVWFPDPPGGVMVRAEPGELELSPPPEIPQDGEGS
jgi:hypothetical protein